MAEEKQEDGEYEIYAVGANNYNHLGPGAKTKPLTKWTSLGTAKAQSITLGASHSIIRNGDEQIAFGDNEQGQCGVGTRNKRISGTAITFFSRKQIQISKICGRGDSTFWVASGHVYGAGRNTSGELGIKNKQNQRVPTLINDLRDIDDIQTGSRCSLALTKDGRVFSCGVPGNPSWFLGQHGHAHNRTSSHDSGWRQVQHLANITVTQIAARGLHSVFLDSTGAVWVCGQNKYGENGIGKTTEQSDDKTRPPTKVAYFAEHNISITHIASGYDYVLALDTKGTVFAWGRNNHGQCGQDPEEKQMVLSPEAVPSLWGTKCIQIKCGDYHSYVRTQDDQHLLFGLNNHNEVTLLPSTKETVHEATRINSFPYLQGQSRIVDVYLGNDSTCIKYHNIEVSRVCAPCPLCVNAKIANHKGGAAERSGSRAHGGAAREAQRQDVGDQDEANHL